MRDNGQQEMEAALELQKIRNENIDEATYGKGFVREKSVRTSSVIWFSVIVMSVTVVLAFASENFLLLLGLPLIPLAVYLMYRQKKSEEMQRQEFMKRHFMKQGNPDYWGRGNGKEDNA